MPAWFSKLFKDAPVTSGEATDVATAPQTHSAALASAPAPPERRSSSHRDPLKAPRRVVEPTVLADDTSTDREGGIRVKARLEKDNRTTLFMVDRVVLEGYSVWAPFPEAAKESPLAQAIFEVEGVENVIVHGMNVTVTRDPFHRDNWQGWAEAIGAKIRGHLESGEPAVTPAFLERVPPEETIRERLQDVLDRDINPGIASHSGSISLERIEGNTIYIQMQGGCQGCAASTITLRQGVHSAFRDAVPGLGAILDQTDHTAGTNPYYSHLPAEM